MSALKKSQEKKEEKKTQSQKLKVNSLQYYTFYTSAHSSVPLHT